MSGRKPDLKNALVDILINDGDGPENTPENGPENGSVDGSLSILSPSISSAHPPPAKAPVEILKSKTKPAPQFPMAPMKASDSNLAQKRIHDLEREVDLLLEEKERFKISERASKKSAEDMLKKIAHLETQLSDLGKKLDEERSAAREKINERDHQISEMTEKVAGFEEAIQNDFKKIRVKERELQNRLEIMKAEHLASSRAKDEMILELKRQVEQMSMDLEAFNSKSEGQVKNVEKIQDRSRRSVKALRMALSLLEGEEADEMKSEESKQQETKKAQ